MSSPMPRPVLDDAFERIEGTILPCLAMMLDSLIDATAGLKDSDPRLLLAELHTISAELEELTAAVARSHPALGASPPLRLVR